MQGNSMTVKIEDWPSSGRCSFCLVGQKYMLVKHKVNNLKLISDELGNSDNEIILVKQVEKEMNLERGDKSQRNLVCADGLLFCSFINYGQASHHGHFFSVSQ